MIVAKPTYTTERIGPMIVARPTWHPRSGRYNTLWWHEWHEVPWSALLRVQSGYVQSFEYQPGEYHAAVYSHGVRTDVGTFATLEDAQAACDALCAERLGTTLAEAAANWKAWTKKKYEAVKAVEQETRERRTLRAVADRWSDVSEFVASDRDAGEEE